MYTTGIKVKKSSKTAGMKTLLQLQQRGSHITSTSTTKIHEYQSSKNLTVTRSSKISIASTNKQISPYNLQKAHVHAKPGGSWKDESTSKILHRLHVQMAMATREREVHRAITGSTKKAKK